MALEGKTGKSAAGETHRMRDGQSGAGMVPMFLGRRVPVQQPAKQA